MLCRNIDSVFIEGAGVQYLYSLRNLARLLCKLRARWLALSQLIYEAQDEEWELDFWWGGQVYILIA